MEMNVERRIAAKPGRVWAALNNTEILKASIPGCESLEVTGENEFSAQVTTRIGPVKAKFHFIVTLSDLNPPHSYTINAQGQGGAAGFANGSAAVSLRPDGEETLLAYHARANIGGKLAQLGARLVDATAAKLAGEFFDNFNAAVAGPQGVGGQAAASPAATPALVIPQWVWLLALAVLAALGYWMLGS